MGNLKKSKISKGKQLLLLLYCSILKLLYLLQLHFGVKYFEKERLSRLASWIFLTLKFIDGVRVTHTGTGNNASSLT